MWIKDKNKEETEVCVLCGRKTSVLKTTPIDQRAYYVEGCGQLCPACGRQLNHDAQRIE